MNRDDIIRMAREAGLMVETSDGWDVWQPDNLESFATLVYERAFIDGMQKQMQSSVDKAVNKMAQRNWQGLTDEEIMGMLDYGQYGRIPEYARNFVDAIEAKLKERNNG